jgi:hypothetical protein
VSECKEDCVEKDDTGVSECTDGLPRGVSEWSDGLPRERLLYGSECKDGRTAFMCLLDRCGTHDFNRVFIFGRASFQRERTAQEASSFALNFILSKAMEDISRREIDRNVQSYAVQAAVDSLRCLIEVCLVVRKHPPGFLAPCCLYSTRLVHPRSCFSLFLDTCVSSCSAICA